MKCPKCNSDNVQVRAKKSKNPVMTGCVLALGGFGLMFLGVVGAVIGVILGVVIGLVVKGLMSTTYDSVVVCQACGFVGNALALTPTSVPVVSEEKADANNLILIRESSSIGSAVTLSVRVDERPLLIMKNGQIHKMIVKPGTHTIFYRQDNGMGKNNRTGTYNIKIENDETRYIHFTFTKTGIEVVG